jgi:methylenetetrahydrofolate reductase (NADPH)
MPQFPTTTGQEAGRWCPTGSGDGAHIVTSNKLVDLVAESVKAGKPFCSFEYFPPRTDDGVKNLYDRIQRMAQQKPLFVDFTWGAGGSTSDLTVELCTKTKAMTGLDVNMHMTCTNQPAVKVDEGLAAAVAGGIRNICALRGDPPLGQEKWEAVAGGFNCALDLVKHIRKTHGDHFGISVSGYPEGHPDNIKPVKDLGRALSASEQKRVMRTAEGEECVCSDEDYAVELKYLKEKVDAGGEVIITQLFYDVEVFIQFAKDCKAAGIHAPILPGIMIIQAYGGFKRMTGFCKTRVPAELEKKMEAMKDDAEAVKEFGIEFGADLCRALLKSGLAPGLHFYTLNLEKSTLGIMAKLGMKRAETAVGNESENTFAGTLINTVIKN